MSKMRVLAHVDLDAFYTQVEAKRDPSLKAQPLVVVQYNPYGDLRTLKPWDDRLFPDSNGSIIAVSYEARRQGVKRNMMAQAAKKVCPDLRIVQVPVAHGKADLTIYREAGSAVINILSSGAVCERASIDEAYLDVTAGAQQLLAAAAQQQPAKQGQQQQQGDVAGANRQADSVPVNSSPEPTGNGGIIPLPEAIEDWHVASQAPSAAGVYAWWSRPADAWAPDEQLLAAGAVLVAQLRAAVAKHLGFSCSAGIAHSKILAKLGSGLNKPAQQTLVPAATVSALLNPLPLPKLRQLGGKFGEEVMAGLGINTVGELAAIPLARLEAFVGQEQAAWLSRLAQGKDDEEVKPRTLPKSISCGKTFRGNTALNGSTAVHKWLQELAAELQERIEADRKDYQRLPQLLTVSIDSAGADSEGQAAAAAAAASSAGASNIIGGPTAAEAGNNSATATGGNSYGRGRTTPQNWRAGGVTVSRSCALRRPIAEVMADDALKLVKKWARERGQGWRIVGMFVSASNFVAAPTGASTLDRFVAARQHHPLILQQQQQHRPQQPRLAIAALTAQPGQHVNAAANGGKEAAVHSMQQEPTATAAVTGRDGGDNSSTPTAAGRGVKRPAAALASSGGSGTWRANSSSRSSSKAKQNQMGLRAFLVAQPPADSGEAPSPYAPAPDEVGNVLEALNSPAGQHVLQATNAQEPEQASCQSMGVAAPYQLPSVAAGAAAGATDACMADVHHATNACDLLTIGAAAAPPADDASGAQGMQPCLAADGVAMASSQQAGRPVFALAALHAIAEGRQQQQQQQHVTYPWHPFVVSQGTAAGTSSAPTGSELVGGCSQPAGPSSLPSQPLVGSLRDWLAHSQQEQQQTAQEQQQQQVQHYSLQPQWDQQLHVLEQQGPSEEGIAAAIDSVLQPPTSQFDDAAVLQPELVAAGTASAAAVRNEANNPEWQQPVMKLQDIDPAVLAELPYDIQLEVKRAAGAGAIAAGTAGATSSKSSSGSSKQGSRTGRQLGIQRGAISKYFTPTTSKPSSRNAG